METNPHNIDPSEESAALKKKRLWRNIFLFNLCVTIFLIAIFWVPLKVLEISDFAESPSVNLPQKGQLDKNVREEATQAVYVKNILAPQSVLINASSDKDWVFFDFSRGSKVDIHDPTSLEWDLAFRRGKVITNGGATNRFGAAGVQDLGEVDFETLTEAPPDSYIQDSATRTETENKILNKWYKYNYITHKLTAKKNVFAVRTAKGKYAKVQFLNFYCANKETGCIKMRYVYQENGESSFMRNSGPWSAVDAAGSQPKEF
ncbi:MAG: HmuY family protein [Nitrospinota bacterium]|nr:HmuY family protein [Nitrospinota bacterium]